MKSVVSWVAVLVLAGSACSSGQHSPIGFRLPETGDASRGRAAFLDLGCHKCHKVAGDNLPVPTADPSVRVTLGGKVYEVRTDGYLVTSIINPSHRLSGSEEQVSKHGQSRMPYEFQGMTVRQLIDLVAFLQSRYEVVAPPQMTP